MKAIRIHETGGPDVMTLEEVPPPVPVTGEAVVRLEAIGVNFIDVNHRSGAYPVPLPFTPGSEGAGVVVETGGDTHVEAGDRVAFAGVRGAYAEMTAVPARRLVPVPDGVELDVAAAVLLQGMTAHFLTHSVCELKEGDWVLVHAAAGGVGSLLTQMAKAKGLSVLGAVSSAVKAEQASEAGADEVVVYGDRDFAEAAREVTAGRGMRAVFDAVGRDTFDKSIECLERRGHMVLYGQASGPPPQFDPRRLGNGSLFLTRPRMEDYTATRDELLWRSEDVFAGVASGTLKVHVHARYPL
ncbi:MAG: quinone oxidoreductase, partial [Actinomycetota bacterium]|nr:quinone oxidoreductase [Actinomycetota bacterium]